MVANKPHITHGMKKLGSNTGQVIEEYQSIEYVEKETMPVQPDAEILSDSEGNLGNGFTWRFTEGNKLFISGVGHLSCVQYYSHKYHNGDIESSELQPSEFDNEGREEEIYYPISKEIIDHTERLYLSEKITHIDKAAFCNFLHLTKVFLPDSIQEIGDHAFRDCACLSSINIPANVTRIGVSAFLNCIRLQKITLPDNCTICEYAFYNCRSLECVNNRENPGSSTAYKGHLVLKSGAFENCMSLKKVNLGNISYVDQYVFSGCKKTHISLDCIDYTYLYKNAFTGTEDVSVYLGIENCSDSIIHRIYRSFTFYKIMIYNDTFSEMSGKVQFEWLRPHLIGTYSKNKGYNSNITFVFPKNYTKSLRKKMRRLFKEAQISYR